MRDGLLVEQGGLRVVEDVDISGGAVINGGLDVTSGGARVDAGGMRVADGVTLSDALTVEAGGANISGGTNVSGRVTIQDGLVVETGDVVLQDGKFGISVANPKYKMDIQANSHISAPVYSLQRGAPVELESHGSYVGHTVAEFQIEIDGPDTFRWRKCEDDVFVDAQSAGCTDYTSGVVIQAGSLQALAEGVSIKFN
eukprot:COSAG03_NODE_8641_length_784_cov_1.143066_2_plen_197_part_01